MPLSHTSTSALTAAAVHKMALRIQGHVVRTPTTRDGGLGALTGATVYLKHENLQHTGAFKARGAAAKLLGLTEAQKGAGVIAMSAGNHAQGVAFYARALGIPATLVMPKGTPFGKVRRTRDLGATVMLEGDTLNDAAAFAQAMASRDGITFVHPYNDDDVIAGQGTMALEMLQDAPDLDTLILPIGGGGLFAGSALIAREMKPGLQIIGVQTERFPSMFNAFTSSSLPCGGATVAEGIAVTSADAKTSALVRRLADDVISVSEDLIERAIATLFAVSKTVAEGAGAAPLAALLQDPARFHGHTVGLAVSGGNIDSRLMSSVLMRDLLRNAQVLTLNIEMPDKPGQLHRVSGICADRGANVLEVSHDRFAMDLSAGTALLAITVETRDRDHANELVAAIRAADFTVNTSL